MFAEKINAIIEQAKEWDAETRLVLIKRLYELDEDGEDMHDEEQASQLLTGDAWWEAFNSLIIRVPVNPDWSDRREDWYDDDGR